MAIRFNANEESVEDVTKACDSLSGSPIHGNVSFVFIDEREDVDSRKFLLSQSEDSSWRKDFLQGTFFSRKRSGSSENVATPPTTTSTSVPTANESPSVGTWRLIKGRVSQAMEDIKSSKPDSGKIDANDDDSDVDSATINSSISDDFNEAVAFQSTPPKQSLSRLNNTDSDSEMDADTELDSASLTKSSSNKKRSTTDSILSRIGKTREEIRSSSSGSLLRRRKRGITPPVRPPRQKDIEIESGVEITEEMSLGVTENVRADEVETKNVNDENCMPTDDIPHTNDASVQPILDSNSTTNTKSIFQHAINHRGIVFVAVAAFTCWLFDIPSFIQGVLACLCSMIIFSKFCEAIVTFLNQRLSSTMGGDNDTICAPERGTFSIPDYDTMPVCRVPPVEEHKQLKNYSGWMNQINNYDPTNYHISMTRSVFVKLDGSKLSISSTNARVPKRSMWNEQQIDLKTITFTKRSCYDLIGASIEMCPKGLARKR